MATTALVPNSTNEPADSTASLAQEVARASSWIDEICFHGLEGSLAAGITTEADYFKVKPDGSMAVICNYRPVVEVLGMGFGVNPSQVSNIDSSAAQAIAINNKVLTVPSFAATGQPVGYIGQWPSLSGAVYVVWQYVAGYPHTSLAASAAQGATQIEVHPSDLAGVEFVGVDASTTPMQLFIRDGGSTETVTVSSISGLTCALAAPLQFAHTVPAAPDFIPVTAVPWRVEQAAISLTSVLLKARGTRSQILGAAPGAKPSGTAIAEAGATSDMARALKLLKPYVNVFVRA